MCRSLFPDPLLSESLGVLKATNFGLNLGLNHIMLEGDLLQIVKDITKEEES